MTDNATAGELEGMAQESAGLVPPPEHAHLRWHWLIAPACGFEPEQLTPARWFTENSAVAPLHWKVTHHLPCFHKSLSNYGWRYHGPCDPSAITLNPDDPAQIAEIGQQIDAFTQKMFNAVVDYASRDDLSRAVIRRLKELKR